MLLWLKKEISSQRAWNALFEVFFKNVVVERLVNKEASASGPDCPGASGVGTCSKT